MRKHWKHIVVSVGILAATFGWLVDRTTPNSTLDRILVPQFEIAKRTYERLVEGQVVSSETEGFAEICALVSYGEPRIDPEQIDACRFAGLRGLDMERSGHSITRSPAVLIEAHLTSCETTTVKVRNPESVMRQVFFEKPLKGKSDIIFWAGITSAIVGLILEIRGSGRRLRKPTGP